MNKPAVLNSQISEDPSQPSDDDNDSQESVEQCFIPTIDRNLNYDPNFSHIAINVAFTNYPVVKEVAKALGMCIVSDKEETDWDLCWTDHPITPETFIRMHFHQTISYLPGIHTIARKNELGKRLNAMEAAFPQQYSFHPRTWMLPEDFSQLRRHLEGPGKGSTYIVKPEADCQGRGIYLVNRLDDIAIGEHCVVQKYIDNPLLIDKYKFDLRVYVLVGSIDPLRIYIYHDGLARFATEAYCPANRQNFKSSFQHLTNYAINKLNPKFKAALTSGDEEAGFKRSLKAALKNLADSGVDTETLWSKIEEIAVKTVILGYEKIRKNYVSCQPEEYHNRMAFHILGLDIFIDDQLQPYLLEVNHTPSFATETSLDSRIKTNLIRDTILLMNCQDVGLKHQLFQKAKTYSSNRRENGIRQSFRPQVRSVQVQVQLQKRLQYESHRLGGYKVIYPAQDQQQSKKYNSFIFKAKQLFEPTKASRKNPHQHHGDSEKEKEKNREVERDRQKEREREKQKERERLRQKQRERERDRHKEMERLTLKEKRSEIKVKVNPIASSRGVQQQSQIHRTVTSFIKSQLVVCKDQMLHTSMVAKPYNHCAKIRQPRAFTIKTKYSIPEVQIKAAMRQAEPEAIKHKRSISRTIASSSKGEFIKLKIYDVPSLVLTNYAPEEQKIIRRKNKDGKMIFHLSKS